MKNKYIPLYIRIKSDIINKIASGELRKGDRLPPERELAEKFNVSRITVVGALRDLESDGLITKIRGSGSYVSRESLEEDYEDIFLRIAGKAETEISFGVFNSSPRYELLMKTFAGLFQLENPDVKVNIVNIDPTKTHTDDIYLQKIGGGEAPTVGEFFLHADYAAINALLSLEDMPGYDSLINALHPECVYETADADGQLHVHAIASKLNTRVVLANTNILKEAGVRDIDSLEDWAKLKEWIEKLGRYTSSNRTECYGCHIEIPRGWHGVIGNFPYLWGAEAAYENSLSGFINMLKAPDCAKGLEFLSEMISIGNPAPFNGGDFFALGRIGLLLSGGLWPVILNEQMATEFEIRAYPIPPEKAGARVRSVKGRFSVGIFRSAVKNDKETDAAWRWIKFLFRKKQQYFISSDLNFPALKGHPSMLREKYPDLHSVFGESLQKSCTQFDFKNIRVAMSVLGAEMTNCFQKRSTPEKSIIAAIEQIEGMEQRLCDVSDFPAGLK